MTTFDILVCVKGEYISIPLEIDEAEGDESYYPCCAPIRVSDKARKTIEAYMLQNHPGCNWGIEYINGFGSDTNT